MRTLKEENRKDVQKGILLKGLRDLIDSNTKNMVANMTKLVNNLRKETGSHDSTETRVAKITKPAKVPPWTKKISVETCVKQLTTLSEINQDVPENVKYHDLIEEFKKNGDMRGLPEYDMDHILPVLREKRR